MASHNLPRSRRPGSQGVDEIKRHAFFEDVAWDSLHDRAQAPFVPFLPNVASSTDARHFNDFAIFEPAPEELDPEPAEPSPSRPYDALFAGFQYRRPAPDDGAARSRSCSSVAEAEEAKVSGARDGARLRRAASKAKASKTARGGADRGGGPRSSGGGGRESRDGCDVWACWRRAKAKRETPVLVTRDGVVTAVGATPATSSTAQSTSSTASATAAAAATAPSAKRAGALEPSTAASVPPPLAGSIAREVSIRERLSGRDSPLVAEDDLSPRQLEPSLLRSEATSEVSQRL